MKKKGKNPKYGKDFWMFKAPLELRNKFDKIRIERIKKGKDKKIQSYERIGKAIARHENLVNDLIRADFIEEDLE